MEQTKKNKTWEGDAFLAHVGTTVSLISEKGKVYVLDHPLRFVFITRENRLGIRTWKDQLVTGHVMQVSGKEVGIVSRPVQ